jgi:hypothetical protein
LAKWQSFGNNGKKRTWWKRHCGDSHPGGDAILSIARSGEIKEAAVRRSLLHVSFPGLDDFDNCGDYDQRVASVSTYFFCFMATCAIAGALLAIVLRVRAWSAFAVRVFDWPMDPVSLTGLVVSFFSEGLLLINDLV